MDLFDKLRITDDAERDLVVDLIRAKTRSLQKVQVSRSGEIKRELTRVEGQKNELLNLRLSGEIDPDTYASKSTEFRDRASHLTILIDAGNRNQEELAEITLKTFELSQSLKHKLFTADYDAKRRILDIVCLNFLLEDVTLVPTMRKPFDMLVEGLVLSYGEPSF